MTLIELQSGVSGTQLFTILPNALQNFLTKSHVLCDQTDQRKRKTRNEFYQQLGNCKTLGHLEHPYLFFGHISFGNYYHQLIYMVEKESPRHHKRRVQHPAFLVMRVGSSAPLCWTSTSILFICLLLSAIKFILIQSKGDLFTITYMCTVPEYFGTFNISRVNYHLTNGVECLRQDTLPLNNKYSKSESCQAYLIFTIIQHQLKMFLSKNTMKQAYL